MSDSTGKIRHPHAGPRRLGPAVAAADHAETVSGKILLTTGAKLLPVIAMIAILAGCASFRPSDIRIDPGSDRAAYDADVIACWQATQAPGANALDQVGVAILFPIVGLVNDAATEQGRAAHERRAEACMVRRGYAEKRTK